MKKILILLLMFALILGFAVQNNTLGISYNLNSNVGKKPIDVFIIFPADYTQSLNMQSLTKLVNTYNTHIVSEESLDSLPLPNKGIFYVTFGNENVLKQYLINHGVKFPAKYSSVDNSQIGETKKDKEKDVLVYHSGTKMLWDDKKAQSSVYAVTILDNGVVSEFYGPSNLKTFDINSIIEWINNMYNEQVSTSSISSEPKNSPEVVVYEYFSMPNFGEYNFTILKSEAKFF